MVSIIIIVLVKRLVSPQFSRVDPSLYPRQSYKIFRRFHTIQHSQLVLPGVPGYIDLFSHKGVFVQIHCVHGLVEIDTWWKNIGVAFEYVRYNFRVHALRRDVAFPATGNISNCFMKL